MNPQMYKAASTGDSSFFDNLTDFRQVTIEKDTVLHIAVQFNKHEVAEKIVCLCRCLVGQTNSKGNIPLHVAARVENPQMVSLLIDDAENQDLEIGVHQLSRMVNLERDTALHIAVKYGNFEVVKVLIEKDSELAMYVNNAGESALFLAVDRQHYKIASHILSAAPECSLAGRHGMNVLHTLVFQTSNYINQRMSGMSSIGILLNKYAKLFSEIFGISHVLPSWRTFGSTQEDFVEEVMEKYPCTIKQGDDSGWTPLHMAAQMGNKKYVKLLLEKGNSPTYVKNNEGLSAFHIATKEGNVNVMEELIKKSPDIYKLLDNRGQTALHAAAESGKQKAVSFFLRRPEFEILINEQDKEGNTPMHLAAIKGHLKVVHLLEKGKGLDLNAKNKEGFTTLDYILLQKELDVSDASEMIRNYKIKRRMRMKGAQPSLMGTLLKLGIREAGDGKGMAGSDSVKEENQNNLLVDDKGTARPDYVKSQTNLLIATLIATVTFAAAFTVPGGYHQNTDEGKAVFGKRASFRAFLIADTLAFGLSISSILVHFYSSLGWGAFGFRKRVPRDSFISTYYAIIAMQVAFISGTYTVVPHSLGIITGFILYFLFTITLWGLSLLRRAGKANCLEITAAVILCFLFGIALLWGLIYFEDWINDTFDKS